MGEIVMSRDFLASVETSKNEQGVLHTEHQTNLPSKKFLRTTCIVSNTRIVYVASIRLKSKIIPTLSYDNLTAIITLIVFLTISDAISRMMEKFLGRYFNQGMRTFGLVVAYAFLSSVVNSVAVYKTISYSISYCLHWIFFTVQCCQSRTPCSAV
jgi:hypothetical protein